MGITTHVLDTAVGRPAEGIKVTLYEQVGGHQWQELSTGTTNTDGRVPVPLAQKLKSGIYRLRFDTQKYFESQKVLGFYPYADVVFQIRDVDSHYHIPLLLSPYGYSTYRGS